MRPHLLLCIAVFAGVGACRPAAPPASLADLLGEDPSPLWIPRRVGSFHLAVFQQDEDPTRGALYRYVGPDSILIDVTLAPGPDLALTCPVDCARAEMRNTARQFVGAITAEPGARTESSAELPATPDAPWRLGHRSTFRHARDGVEEREEVLLYHVPGTRFEIRGRYVTSPLRDRWVAEFLRYVMEAFSSPPIPLPEPTPEAILRAVEGEWDYAGSRLLCGPGRHTIRASLADSSLVVTTPAGDNAPESVDRYRIMRIGPGIIPGQQHVVRAQLPGERRRGAYGELVAWDLVLAASDVYAWHRNDWYDDQRSVNVMRCDRGPY
jgi:hypothetical protein